MRIHRHTMRLVSTVLFAAVLAHRGAEAAELKVCVDQSSASAHIDVNVVKAVARLQGEVAHITWYDGMGDDDDGLKPRTFRKLAAEDVCQLILGFPVDADRALLPEGLKATPPYARTGFVLVTRRHAADSLELLPKGSTVATTYLTAPNLYFASHPDISPEVFTSDNASLRAFLRGQVTAAMLWRPFVAQQLHGLASAMMNVTALSEPHAAWNLVALYADPAQPAAAQFEQGVERLRQSGKLSALLQPYADAAIPEPPPVAANRATKDLAKSTSLIGRLIKVEQRTKDLSKPPPALYTEEQAEAGQLVFQNNCAICHGPKLEGRAGPALKGTTFATPQAHFSVSDVFKILSQNMPAPAPGTLPHEDYVNIMSFLLQQNGYPSGSTPLTFESAGKSRVKLIYRDTLSN